MVMRIRYVESTLGTRARRRARRYSFVAANWRDNPDFTLSPRLKVRLQMQIALRNTAVGRDKRENAMPSNDFDQRHYRSPPVEWGSQNLTREFRPLNCLVIKRSSRSRSRSAVFAREALPTAAVATFMQRLPHKCEISAR